ncbi:uncharacterized protein LACBIDRAFT_317366 [Laccaria bicolor S238N-H82]|uniref:Predicted protein n=1 Tax=Laccaria bicolor (strain S238N-H82 / ATCC MYA-4686) TaxID=486041 RepID=B0D508_LACBS|nr:uncharacterized protein LACBIDRAFT_317366 [Laccaria bicolor S238N-H82]EDR10436.1 predicted protein [Laccaria bicolor S238N-H82]|eukprot:XP_001878886.1 predicted protein [Laccaria bicolor S238N-H82]
MALPFAGRRGCRSSYALFFCLSPSVLLISPLSAAGWVVTFPFDVVKTRVQGSTAALSVPAATPIPSQTSFSPGASLLDRSGSRATDYNSYRLFSSIRCPTKEEETGVGPPFCRRTPVCYTASFHSPLEKFA